MPPLRSTKPEDQAAYVRVRLDGKTKAELSRLRKAHGFKSNYAFLQAAVRLCLDVLRRADQRAVTLSGEEDVAQLFEAMSQWEAVPWGRRPPKSLGRGRDLCRQLFDLEEDEAQEQPQAPSTPSLEDEAPDTARGVDYADYRLRWMREDYLDHYQRFERLPQIQGALCSPTDLMHERLFRLTRCPLIDPTWQEWRAWANALFSPKD